MELRAGDVSLEIDLDGGARASRWTVGDLDLLLDRGADPVERGMYVMAPWAGRLRGNAVRAGARAHPMPANYHQWALHGTVLQSVGELVEYSVDDDRSRLTARIAGASNWPWPMHVEVEWDLTPTVLTTTIGVVAHEEAFPAVVGWHPWFARRLARGGPGQWAALATLRAERGADHVPTGRLTAFSAADGPFDDAFVVPDGRASVRWPGALAIDVSWDAPWLVVFDELADHLCVEPQSGPPNGVNDGLGSAVPLASPGQPHRMVTTWTLRDDPLGVQV